MQCATRFAIVLIGALWPLALPVAGCSSTGGGGCIESSFGCGYGGDDTVYDGGTGFPSSDAARGDANVDARVDAERDADGRVDANQDAEAAED